MASLKHAAGDSEYWAAIGNLVRALLEDGSSVRWCHAGLPSSQAAILQSFAKFRESGKLKMIPDVTDEVVVADAAMAVVDAAEDAENVRTLLYHKALFGARESQTYFEFFDATTLFDDYPPPTILLDADSGLLVQYILKNLHGDVDRRRQAMFAELAQTTKVALVGFDVGDYPAYDYVRASGLPMAWCLGGKGFQIHRWQGPDTTMASLGAAQGSSIPPLTGFLDRFQRMLGDRPDSHQVRDASGLVREAHDIWQTLEGIRHKAPAILGPKRNVEEYGVDSRRWTTGKCSSRERPLIVVERFSDFVDFIGVDPAALREVAANHTPARNTAAKHTKHKTGKFTWVRVAVKLSAGDLECAEAALRRIKETSFAASEQPCEWNRISFATGQWENGFSGNGSGSVSLDLYGAKQLAVSLRREWRTFPYEAQQSPAAAAAITVVAAVAALRDPRDLLHYNPAGIVLDVGEDTRRWGIDVGAKLPDASMEVEPAIAPDDAYGNVISKLADVLNHGGSAAKIIRAVQSLEDDPERSRQLSSFVGHLAVQIAAAMSYDTQWMCDNMEPPTPFFFAGQSARADAWACMVECSGKPVVGPAFPKVKTLDVALSEWWNSANRSWARGTGWRPSDAGTGWWSLLGSSAVVRRGGVEPAGAGGPRFGAHKPKRMLSRKPSERVLASEAAPKIIGDVTWLNNLVDPAERIRMVGRGLSGDQQEEWLRLITLPQMFSHSKIVPTTYTCNFNAVLQHLEVGMFSPADSTGWDPVNTQSPQRPSVGRSFEEVRIIACYPYVLPRRFYGVGPGEHTIPTKALRGTIF